ncbi:MAG: efflux RND transporter periplasmic adaptor subunit [Myxococcota bacterium]
MKSPATTEATSQLQQQLASLRLEPEPPARSSSSRPVVVAAVLVVIAGIAGLLSSMPSIMGGSDLPVLGSVRIASVSNDPTAVELTVTGYVTAPVTSDVGSPIAGTLAERVVHRGDRVEPGDVLFRLDSIEHDGALARAEARERVAQMRAAARRTELRQAEHRAKVEARLVAQGTNPADRAREEEATAERLRAELATARAELAAARADTEFQRQARGRLTVRAPIAGTVAEEPTAPGELVGGPLSQPVVKLVDLQQLRVHADLPETQLSTVQVGAPCEVTLTAYPDRRYTGRVHALATGVDRVRAALEAEIELVAPDGDVRPGMAARIDILPAPRADTPRPPVVPAAAVAERGGRSVVFVVDGDRVRATTVRVGSSGANGIELLDGPAPGTPIIDVVPPDLEDGQQFQLRNE